MADVNPGVTFNTVYGQKACQACQASKRVPPAPGQAPGEPIGSPRGRPEVNPRVQMVSLRREHQGWSRKTRSWNGTPIPSPST